MIETLIALIAALVLDKFFGEPKRWHPLVGFGKLAVRVERNLNSLSPWGRGLGRGGNTKNAASPLTLPPHPDPLPQGEREEDARILSHQTQLVSGIIAILILIAPLTLLTLWITNHVPLPVLFETLILYLALGGRSLIEHADQVHHALAQKNTSDARLFTSYLVSRDTSNMSERDMSRATIESVLENGCDAVFAPLFWFLIGGAPAALCYRLANTLDAMWGYRTKRYAQFGWAAARFDDVLNLIPARLTAFTYALTGQFNTALTCWYAQATSWKSPNAGPVMASGAGALKLQLGGPALYHGELQDRPVLGMGSQPDGSDIARSTKLLQRGILLWGTLAALFLLWAMFTVLITGGLYFG